MGAGDVTGAPDGARGCVATAFAGLSASEEAGSGPPASAHTAGCAQAVDGARAMSGGLTTIACGQEAMARSAKMVSADDHLRSIHTDHWKHAVRVAEASTTMHNLRSGGAGARGAFECCRRHTPRSAGASFSARWLCSTSCGIGSGRIIAAGRPFSERPRPARCANSGSLGTHGVGCSHPLEPNALERVSVRFECCSSRKHTRDSSERAGSNACCGKVSPRARRREPDLVGDAAVAFEPWGA